MAWLGSFFTWSFPPRKYQDSGMALEGTAQHLRSLDTKANPTIFNCGDRSLRDARSLRKLVLAEFLQLAKNSDRLPDGHLYPFLGGTIVFHQSLR